MAGRSRRPLVAGNWKMHGLRSSRTELEEIVTGASALAATADLMVCPPATLIAAFAESAHGSPVLIGGQDCHAEAAGAFTGDISAEMLRDADVCSKALAAWRAGLLAIVCVGETKNERERGATLDVVARQLAGSLPDGATADNLVIAYEPVWAIGTGLTPTSGDVGEVHSYIRRTIVTRFGTTGEGVRLLYGGSVKPANAAELMRVDDVDGALVGGASLKAKEFLAIAAAPAAV
jgi:triosephosphate isomerase (TIM)